MLLVRFAYLSLKALVCPESPQQWRFAFAYFVYPLVVLGIAGIVSIGIMKLLPSPIDVLLVIIWLLYFLIAEPYMHFIENHAWDDWDRWIETGEL